MPDYNLHSLSTRSFEQLVQALSLKVFGPSVTIFGDGPDGGREATFSGTVPYPQPKNWSGYGVIQAKFLQKPKDVKSDGDWAIKQLRAELAKFESRPGRRPDYYVYVTNVVLTPVHGSGSKDRMNAVMKKECKKLNIRDWAVWDYDKLRVLLDGDRDVATAYAAGITPGDVLQKLLDHLPSLPHFDSLISNFLQKELISDQYARLEQAGHAPNERILLSNVFIDVPISFDASASSSVEPCLSRLIEQGKTRFASKSTSETDRKLGHVVIVGGPGQGKTTVGQYLCQIYRASLLKDRHNLTSEGRALVDEISQACTLDDLELPSYRRFPLRVELNVFAASLASGETVSLLSFLTDKIRRRTGGEINIPTLRTWLSKYAWLVVLDGLDEVPASSNREQVLEAVRDFMVDVTDCDADAMIIATTRPQGYTDDFSRRFFTHIYLTSLSRGDAVKYSSRLSASRYVAGSERAIKVFGRLERALDEHASSNLMRTPLQVTIMAALVDRLGQAPDQRWELFREYYRSIYERELERDTPAARLLKKHRPTIDNIHARLGLVLQRESEQSGYTDAHLTSSRFRLLVTARLAEDGFEGDELECLTRDIITAASDRLVFIVGLQADRIGFEIRSLQEYHAAEGLLDSSDHLVSLRLKHLAPQLFWRQVLLFAVGHIFSSRQSLRDSCILLCDDLDAEEKTSPQVILQAGSILALDLLLEGVARNQPKYERMLARKAGALLDSPDLSLAGRLSQAFNEITTPLLEEQLKERLVGFHEVKRIGAWVCLLELRKATSGWATDQVRLMETSAEIIPEWFHYALNEVELVDASALKAKSLRRLPPFELISNGWWWDRNKRDDEDLEAAQLAPFLAVLTYSFQDALHTNILFGKEELHVGVTVKPIARAEYKALVELMPELGPGWESVKLCEAFLRHPNAKTLSASLVSVMRAKAAGADTRLVNGLPWPLRSALSLANQIEDSAQMFAGIAEGKYGDIKEWKLAEKRWQSDGIDILEMASGNAEPFSPDIATSGFPINAFISVTHSSSRGANDQALRRELLRMPLGRGTVEAIIVSMIVPGHFWDTDVDSFPLDFLVRIAASDWNFLSDGEVQKMTARFPEKAKVILEEWGKHRYAGSLITERDQIVEMASEVKDHPTKLGLLWTVVTSALEQKVKLSDLLPNDLDIPKEWNELGILLRLATTELESADSLADDVCDSPLMKKQRLLKQALESNPSSLECKCAFLSTFFRKVPITRVPQRRFVYEQLGFYLAQVPHDIALHRHSLGLSYL